MPMTEAERKAKREEGRRRELDEMTVAKRVQRRLTNGRPAVSELKTPNAALTAARVLHREIAEGIADETHGLRPGAAEYFAVVVGYVSPDLSVLGFTPPYETGADKIERTLSGNIALGLIFGIADGAEILMGVRPFLATKQSSAWLSELIAPVQSEFESERKERPRG